MVDLSQRLKSNAMCELFTRGLRGEPQKETAIGAMPESWSLTRLGDLGRIGNGSTPKKDYAPYWTGGSFPWLTSCKMYDRDIVSADAFVTDVALRECHLPVLRPGCVLIAITGQGKTLGHCAVLRMQATINQHVAYVDVDPSKADASFVRGFLETQYEVFRKVGAGGGTTKGALTCGYLKTVELPLPSLAEQQEIAAILDALDRKIALHVRKRDLLEQLFQSLLHQLLTGAVRVDDLDLAALDATTKAVSA
jgi:type I restriction enzyme S subunit